MQITLVMNKTVAPCTVAAIPLERAIPIEAIGGTKAEAIATPGKAAERCVRVIQ